MPNTHQKTIVMTLLTAFGLHDLAHFHYLIGILLNFSIVSVIGPLICHRARSASLVLFRPNNVE